MVKKVLILINPVSGVGKQKTIEKLISAKIDSTLLSVDIQYTQYHAHAHELAKGAVGKYDVIVAVGGDGTVNEIGTALISTDTAMAIVPTGSGNGLARHLKIPLNLGKAVALLNNFQTKCIDTIKINDLYSLNVAGIGFDAHISHLFAKREHRGVTAYMKLVASEFTTYKAGEYHLTIDNKELNTKAYLISFANSSQYGNNIYIAPDAEIDDGFIDVCIVNGFPKIIAPAMLISMLGKDNIRGYLDKIVKAKKIVIEHPDKLTGHVDGEPVFLGKKVTIEINPLSLKVIVP